MEPLRIVARYRDGRLVKGSTNNFSPGGVNFLMMPVGAAPGTPPTLVDVKSLKAVFFVRDFAGNRNRQDKQTFDGQRVYQGRRVKVQFADGEVFIGSAPSYNPSMPGFFVFPADPQSNTIKIYAVAESVRSVTPL